MDQDGSGATPAATTTGTTNSSKSDDQPEITDKSDSNQDGSSATAALQHAKTAATVAPQPHPEYEHTGSLKLSSLRKGTSTSIATAYSIPTSLEYT